MAGQCTTDTEWSIGWFWGTNGVSEGSCKQYNEIYSSTVCDIWGMCAEYDNADAEWTAEWTEEDQAEAQRFFELTSRWHPMPTSGGNPCPGDGWDRSLITKRIPLSAPRDSRRREVGRETCQPRANEGYNLSLGGRAVALACWRVDALCKRSALSSASAPRQTRARKVTPVNR